MNYNEIKALQNKKILYTPLVDYYAYFFSPFFTSIFIKYSIIPNKVTLFMIISGVFGAVLFAFPHIILKIAGIFFIHLWYILDASDGEVARITKKFSKYGKELDYTAHVINHPLFILSFSLSIFKEQKLVLILLMILCIDTMVRNSFAFEEIKILKNPQNVHDKNVNRFNLVKYLLLTIDNFPLFALCFPILNLVALKYGIHLLYIFTIIKLTVSFCIVSRSMIRWILYIYKS